MGAANGQRTFAQASRAGARDVSASATAILSDNDGAMIEAMHVAYSGDSKAVEAQSDLFGSMAEAVDECSRIVRDARTQMDAIDQQAHEAIQKIIDSKGGWFGPLAMLSMIWAILTQARAAADAVSAAAVANIGSQAMRVQAATAPMLGAVGGPPVQATPYRPDGAGHFFQAGNDIPKHVPGPVPEAPIRDDANAPPEKVAPDNPPAPSPNAPIRDDDSAKVPHDPRTQRLDTLQAARLQYEWTRTNSPGPPYSRLRQAVLASCRRSVRPPLCRAAG